jgi:trimethylamine--corrinoid protein Co-methyltransferase
VYPDLGDRLTPSEWMELGATSIAQRSRQKTQEILASHFPSHIPEEVDQRIREKFDIRIPREQMTLSD